MFQFEVRIPEKRSMASEVKYDVYGRARPTRRTRSLMFGVLLRSSRKDGERLMPIVTSHAKLTRRSLEISQNLLRFKNEKTGRGGWR